MYMKLIALPVLLLAAVAGQAEDLALRGVIEKELDACKGDFRVLFRWARERPADFRRELTAILDAAKDTHRLGRSIVAFRELARQRLVSDTPARIVHEAQAGDPTTRIFAVEAAAHIGDQKAVDLIVKLLRTLPEAKDAGNLLYVTELHARHTGSSDVAAALLPFAKRGSIASIESLAHIGIGFAPADLRDVKGNQLGYVRTAVESATILSAPDRETRLLETLRRGPSPGGWFSWPEWGLDKIERLKLTGTLGPLRKLHAEFEKCPHSFPDHEHYRRYWSLLRVRMLRTIQRLGGEVSAEECRMILDNPYLQ